MQSKPLLLKRTSLKLRRIGSPLSPLCSTPVSLFCDASGSSPFCPLEPSVAAPGPVSLGGEVGWCSRCKPLELFRLRSL